MASEEVFEFWVYGFGFRDHDQAFKGEIWDLGFKVKEFKKWGRRGSAYMPTPSVRGGAKNPNPKIP